MSLLEYLFAQKAPDDDFWYTPISSSQSVASGVSVDHNTAMNYSACWSATRILTETVAALPKMLYRRVGEGKERARETPLFRVLHDEPNPDQDSMAWFDQQMAAVVNWGDAFAEKERNRRQEVVALWPIHPSRIPKGNIQRNSSGELVYMVRNDDGTASPVSAADMLHVRGPLSDDGVRGKGVITQARESIGMGLVTERFGAAFFGNGASARVVLKHPAQLSPAAHENLRKEWREMHVGANAHSTAILEEGMDIANLSIPPEEAQFLQTRQHNITEIARWYRVPPHMLADLSRATFSNIEFQGIEFVTHSILPWVTRWEQAINKQLISDKNKPTLFAEFLVDGLLRGDAKSRAEAFQTQFLNGAINQDEWRSAENRNPLPDGLGQKHYVPLNLRAVDEPIPEPSEPPEPEEDDDTEEQRALLLESAKSLTVSVLDRMLTKEKLAASRAARKPGEFLAWMDRFYDKHTKTVTEALGPLAPALQSLGVSFDPSAMAERHVAESRETLLEASECQPDELCDKVAKVVVWWASRPEKTAETIG